MPMENTNQCCGFQLPKFVTLNKTDTTSAEAKIIAEVRKELLLLDKKRYNRKKLIQSRKFNNGNTTK
jgi:hypothetical protein